MVILFSGQSVVLEQPGCDLAVTPRAEGCREGRRRRGRESGTILCLHCVPGALPGFPSHTGDLGVHSPQDAHSQLGAPGRERTELWGAAAWPDHLTLDIPAGLRAGLCVHL